MGDDTHLSMSDRRRFHIFLEMGLSMTEIVKRLSKHRSALYREPDRNKAEGAYLPGVAQEKTEMRAKQKRLSKIEILLRIYVHNAHPYQNKALSIQVFPSTYATHRPKTYSTQH